jgi:serine protein kinase
MYNDSLFNAFARSFEARSETDMSMSDYLESCRDDPMRYANAAERILAAIGEPQMIDTAKDPRLGRIFLNRTVRAYPDWRSASRFSICSARWVAASRPSQSGSSR